MSYKFDSLVIILNKLDCKAKVTTESLTEDLEVSKRTVHRYISTLQTAGFPIDYDHNNKTYAFTGGYTLRKPNLSLEETLAFCLARKMLCSFGPGMEKGLGGIEKKLAVIRSPELGHIVLTPETIPLAVEPYLAPIHQAITNHLKIEMTYKAYGAKKPTARTVDPYYLFFSENIWYFRGFHHKEKALRTFALDRIASLKVLDRHFVPGTIVPEEELSAAFGAFIDGEPVDIVLRFDEASKDLILRKKWHNSQETHELPEGGGLDVSFRVNGILGIRRWIHQWTPHVEVLAPQELRDMVRDDLVNALAKHNGKR